MALAREVESLDGVPEWAKGGYKQAEGGKWVNEDIEDVTGLKNTAAARRAERDAAANELKPFKELGMSPKEIADLKAEVAAKRAAGGSETDIDKVLAKREGEWKKEHLEPLQAERDSLLAENTKLTLTDAVRADFIAAGGIEEDADDEVRLNAGRFKQGDRNEKTGKRKILVLDDEGDVTGMTPKEWFEKVHKAKKPKVYKGKVAAGSGAQRESGGAGDGDLAKLPPAARLTEIRRQAGK